MSKKNMNNRNKRHIQNEAGLNIPMNRKIRFIVLSMSDAPLKLTFLPKYTATVSQSDFSGTSYHWTEFLENL